MENQAIPGSLLAAYCVSGFRARACVDVYEGEHPAFVITLERRQKKRCVADVARRSTVSMTDAVAARAILAAADGKFIWTSRCAA